jgi:hypothetical protein
VIDTVVSLVPAVTADGERPVTLGTGFVAAVTETVALPDLVESCVEVAVMVAVPVAAGVKTPALLTVPMLAGLTDHVTAEL